MREARRYLGAGPQAEDAAQEALMRAWRRRDTCTGSDPQAWLRAIARNEALRVVGRVSELATDDIASVAGAAAADPTHDEGLAAAMLELAERDRLLLLLRYWEDLTYEQVAERLQIPLGTVKVRLHRAHAILHSRLSLEP